MGVSKNVGIDKFPEQGAHLNKRVDVCFNYDVTKRIAGKIVRDDVGSPHMTLIYLADGRYVLGTECQYQMSDDPEVPSDCLAKRAPGEPSFTLLGRDSCASGTIRYWIARRFWEVKSKRREDTAQERGKHAEALRIADEFDEWHGSNVE